jgi:hypothetical protein
MTSREAFEKWWTYHQSDLDHTGTTKVCAWEAWQASRAALIAEIKATAFYCNGIETYRLPEGDEE